MRECITSISYSILVNIQPRCFIKPTKGILQETPSLPICSYCVRKCCMGLLVTDTDGDIKGVSISR